MSKQDQKVVQLRDRRAEFNRTTAGAVAEIFPGFSARLNQLIDLTDLDIPDIGDGRQTYIGELLQASKMACGDWLRKDKPPKPTTLRKLVVYLTEHVPGDQNPYKVEAWLRYGDVAVQNPFDSTPQRHQALIPLATALIVSVAKEIDVPTTSFDLSEVLTATIEILANFHITHATLIEPVHRTIIAQYIHAHPRRRAPETT